MARADTDAAMMEALIARRDGAPPARLRLRSQTLRGGLEADSLDRLTAHYVDPEGRDRTFAVVVKRLLGATAREAAVYEHVVTPHASDLAPHLHAVTHAAPERAVVYMEALDPVSTWPWGDRRAAQSVLEAAAALHGRPVSVAARTTLAAWDYEAELQSKAAQTLALLEQARRQPALWSFGNALRWTARVVSALPELRRQLLAFDQAGSTLIHGDLHSGNVVLRQSGDTTQPVLIDWARARIGSPLEDVSSWLQSLGAWEAEARRRHDTLFVGYLAARGMEPRLHADLRAAYWLAGASNALAGALLYYLALLMDPQVPSSGRAGAANLVREWVRVLRRADAFWT